MTPAPNDQPDRVTRLETICEANTEAIRELAAATAVDQLFMAGRLKLE